MRDGGYRDSASEIRRVYGDIGYKGDSAEFHLNIGAANNLFGATASAPIELLQQSWSASIRRRRVRTMKSATSTPPPIRHFADLEPARLAHVLHEGKLRGAKAA